MGVSRKFPKCPFSLGVVSSFMCWDFREIPSRKELGCGLWSGTAPTRVVDSWDAFFSLSRGDRLLVGNPTRVTTRYCLEYLDLCLLTASLEDLVRRWCSSALLCLLDRSGK